MPKNLLLIILLFSTLYISVLTQTTCTRQRCCLSSPCTQSYCTQRNSQTWISTQNFANYQFTKLTLSNNECKPCPYDCRACTSQTTCDTCAKGFYKDTLTAKCTLCSDRCTSCTVVNSVTKCSSCEDGTYLDTVSQSCKSCPQGAKTCSSPTAIIDCNSGFKKSSNSLYCTPCPSNCISCPVADTTCASCATGYYLNSGLCIKCTIPNCGACLRSGSTIACTSCNSGYLLISGSCSSCPSNCRSCSSISVCTVCNTGFYILGGACSPVSTTISNCMAYSSSTSCSACNTGFYLTSNVCYPCSLLCSNCDGTHFGRCSSCNSNAALFNRMCLIINFPSPSTFNTYYSFPASSSLITSGTLNCANQYLTGSKITISLNNLKAFKLEISWKIYSRSGSSTYTVGLTNSAGTTTSVYSTSTSLKYNNLCSGDLTTFYNLGIERSQIFTSIKKQNTLTFSTDNGVTLALHEIIITAYKCNELCIQCSQTLCTECLMTKLYTQDAYCVYTCSNNYYIYQNSSSLTNPKQCLSECPLGSFTMTSNASCVPCTSPCLTCLNEQFCLSCVDGFYLTKSNTCNKTCPYRYYGKIQTKTCEKCVGRCLECLSQQQCLSCRVGFLLNTTKNCIDSCQFATTNINGLYASLTTLYCQACNSNCLNCLYSSTQCTQCISSKFLLNQQCLNACPTGYFAPSGSNVCQSCEYPCKTCSLTSLKCTSCLQGYLYNNGCVNDCPSGFYEDNVNLLCTACDSKCIECYGTSTYCISCKSGFYYFQYGCYASCPFGYYPQKDSNICTDCVNLCLSCTNQTFCLSCRSNFLYQGNCVSSGECPKGYFADMVTLTCQKCSAPCLQCQYNSTHCTKCDISNTNGLIYLQNNNCLKNCSSTFYYPKNNGVTATCEPCEEPCLTCTSASLCLSCISGYKYSNSMCSSTCSIGTYFDTSLNDCANCPAKCDVCTSGLFCQKCQTNYFINFISSTQNQCVSTCPSTFYAQSLSSSCQKCIFPCDTCSSSIDCVSCLSGVIYASRCISSCPDSTFLDISSNKCVSCQGNCLTCSGLPTLCQSCKDGYFLFYGNRTCMAVCPLSYFAENTTKSCLECPSTCYSCVNSTYCLACVQNKTFMTTTNVCVEYCPVGYFGNNMTSKCDKCDTKCLNCQYLATNCISCPNNYLFIKLTYDLNDCQMSCPQGYYGESSYCYECTFPCKTCMSSSKCITCIEGTFYHANSSSCLLNCPTKTFYNYVNLTCQSCKYPCSSCDGSQSACLSCSNTTDGSTLYLYNGGCVSSCPSGYYADDSGVCNKCYGLCSTCSSKYYCLTCIVGYIYDGFCYSTCPLGTFANTTINSCQPCQQPCSQCVIKPTYCTKCANSMFVYKGNCSYSCPLGTYQNNGQCVSCDFPCVQCQNSKTCNKCLGGYLLYMNISCIADISICPNDFYKMDSKQCAPVTWCPGNYLIDQNLRTCSSECDRKKYTNTKTGRCQDSCSEGWYAGINLVCQQWNTNPPISLMGMTAITYISSSYLYLEILFNQTATWLDVSTNMYTFSFVESTRLLQNTLQLSSPSRILTSSYSVPQYSTTLEAPTILKLKPNSYPERIQLQLPAYRLKSSQTSYPLQNPSTVINLPLFTPYSSEQIYSGMIVGQFSEGISWFILLLSFFFLFKNRLSDLYVLWDTIQLLYLLIFLDIQYPPNVNQFFRGLKFTHFTFIPSIFSSPSTRKISSSPFYAYSIDNSFLRNTGGLFLALIIVFGILILLKIAELLIKNVKSVKQKMIEYPAVKQFVYKGVLRYRWHHISDVMFLTYAFMIMFAFSEIYYISQNPGYTFSNILAIGTSLVYVLWVLFVAYKLNRHFKNISKGKMVNNLKCFYRGIQKQNKFGIALVLIRYARKLFYALIISVFSTNPMFALPILMFSSVLMSLFLFINLPYKKKLSNMITLGSEIILVIMYILLALINFNNQSFSPAIKHSVGWVVCLLLAATIFALIYQVFCKTMFYLQPQVDPSKLPTDQKEEKMLNDKEKEYLRKKAEEFFDSLLPRLRERLNLDEDSDDELYKNYESGDSQNSQNNEERERQWNDDQSNSEEFKHYDNSENSQEPTSLNSKMKIQQAPHYLVRCVKEIE